MTSRVANLTGAILLLAGLFMFAGCLITSTWNGWWVASWTTMIIAVGLIMWADGD